MPTKILEPENVGTLVGYSLEEVERVLICETLASKNGNRTQTAQMLGISIRCLRDKLRAYKTDGLSLPGPTTPAL